MGHWTYLVDFTLVAPRDVWRELRAMTPKSVPLGAGWSGLDAWLERLLGAPVSTTSSFALLLTTSPYQGHDTHHTRTDEGDSTAVRMAFAFDEARLGHASPVVMLFHAAAARENVRARLRIVNDATAPGPAGVELTLDGGVITRRALTDTTALEELVALGVGGASRAINPFTGQTR